MKRLRLLLLFGLVLAVVLAPCGGVMAGGDDPTDSDAGGTIDSGHPWDDGSNEDSVADPDADTGLHSNQPISGSMATSAGLSISRVGGDRWLRNIVAYYWQLAFGTQTGFGAGPLYFWR